MEPNPELDPGRIRDAVRGDERAVREVARAWWPRMRRWALIELADRPAAEDAAQDALIRLIENIGRFDPARPLGPWLRTLVRNVCHDHRRRGGREVAERAEAVDPRSVDRRLDLDRAASRVVEAFAALPPRQRALLDLCDRQGLTPTEAAAQLDIRPSTARVHLHRARRALREHLGEHLQELHEIVRSR